MLFLYSAVKRPRVQDFFGIPIQCGGKRADRVAVSCDNDDDDSFEIKVKIDTSETPIGEVSSPLGRNVTAISFSKSDMLKAFASVGSGNIVIAASKEIVTEKTEDNENGKTVEGGENLEFTCDISNTSTRLIKQEKDGCNFNNLQASTAISDLNKTKPCVNKEGENKEVEISTHKRKTYKKQNGDTDENHSKKIKFEKHEIHSKCSVLQEKQNSANVTGASCSSDNDKRQPEDGDKCKIKDTQECDGVYSTFDKPELHFDEISNQNYDDRDDVDLDFGTYSPDTSLKESFPHESELEQDSVPEQLTSDSEACDGLVASGKTDCDITAANKSEKKTSTYHKENEKEETTSDKESDTLKHNTIQLEVVKQPEPGLDQSETIQQRNTNENNTESSDIESADDRKTGTDSQILEIKQTKAIEAAHEPIAKDDAEEKKRTPERQNTSGLPNRNETKTNSDKKKTTPDRPASRKSVSPNNGKAIYKIITPRPERKVFFCDICNMGVHDMLMHKAKYHWF